MDIFPDCDLARLRLYVGRLSRERPTSRGAGRPPRPRHGQELRRLWGSQPVYILWTTRSGANMAMRYREVLPITIRLDRDGCQPLSRQIAEQVADAVESGRFARGSRLPSTRTLAHVLGVSRAIVVTAYELLFERGIIEGRLGSGTYVRPGATPAKRLRSDQDDLMDLRPGQVCVEAFPIAAWRSAWRQATFRHPPTRPGPGDGLAELRDAIRDHVRRTRGPALDRHHVIVTGGPAQGLRLVLNALGGPVATPVCLPPEMRRVVRAFGGFDDDRGGRPRQRCRTLVVCADAPPLSAQVMPAARRMSLARWAADSDGYLVELACDAVFRTEMCALAQLTELAPDNVIVVGGFGDIFGAAIGIGYVLVPQVMASRFERWREPPAYVPQRAMALLLENGLVVRVIHRLTRLYTRRRQLARAVLAELPPHIRMGEFDALGRLALHLPAGLDAVRVLRRRGLLVSALDEFCDGQSGIVIGLGHLPESVLEQQLARLVTAAAMLTTQSQPTSAIHRLCER